MNLPSKYQEFSSALNKYKADYKVTEVVKVTKPYRSTSVNQRVIGIMKPHCEDGTVLLFADGTYHVAPYQSHFQF
tara:strand:+ start:99 stop:323 length:225 start_codon:yes stop_codon:yes gene_type:complete